MSNLLAFLIGFLGYLVVLGFIRRYRDYRRTRSLSYTPTKLVETETSTKFSDEEKLPHEIFPELIHWKQGDVVSSIYKRKRDKESYLGLLDGKLYTQGITSGEISSYSPREAYETLENLDATKRFNDFETKKVLKGISQDSYNEFLKVLNEETQKLITE